ncbi:MAG: DIP1984 family protein [Firmicutes bacterium]|nr:DIP1984 family protein [Bacillota bacterium]
MKLANALAERAYLNAHLSELRSRLEHNARYQEGETTAEDPYALLADMDQTLNKLEQLIAKINLVNSTTVKDGKTLTELLAKRDCLSLRLMTLKKFLDIASSKINRYSKTEIPIRSSVSVKDLQKEVDKYSMELRQLDETIQELNWTTEF